MILFWGASALLAAVALFLVMRPLLRRRAAARPAGPPIHDG